MTGILAKVFQKLSSHFLDSDNLSYNTTGKNSLKNSWAIDLKHEIPQKILMLQGPVGPFFAKLRRYFLANGAEQVIKVNFNAGDDFFYNEGDIFYYKRPFHELEEFYNELIKEFEFDAVYLFGDCRKIHVIAHKVFTQNHIPIYVFEEGYIRPHYMTLEIGGVNAKSSLPKNINAMRVPVSDRNYPQKSHGYGGFKKMMFFATIYFFLIYWYSKSYPFYRHHKKISAIDLFFWMRSYFRKPFYILKDKLTQKYIISRLKNKFFFVPLQVYNDSQVTHHSPYHDVKDFIEDVLLSFARYAPPHVRLVFKHHPLDRGHRNYKKFIFNRAKNLNIQNRIFYVHEINLPKFLKNAKGCVTINSTVGLSALFHDTPVKVMGKAFYNITGLTSQIPLKKFWINTGRVNRDNYHIFRNYLINKTQIYGSYYEDLK